MTGTAETITYYGVESFCCKGADNKPAKIIQATTYRQDDTGSEALMRIVRDVEQTLDAQGNELHFKEERWA